MSKINVYSEIGKLNKVMLHRPGKEIENLTPDFLERLLFDDIPFLKVARQEHDRFAEVLKENNVNVVYIEELVAEALDQNPNLRQDFIDKFIKEAKVDFDWENRYCKYLADMKNLDMVKEMIGGTLKIDLDSKDKSEYPFISDPLPNILFTRDPFESIGNGVAVNRMWSETRNRETLLPEFVFKNHKDYKGVSFWYERDQKHNIEGGDVMVLNKDTLIIGASQRTSLEAIESLAKKLFEENTYKKIIALELPKSRAFMHLDTVFTNIDYDKFIAHPLIFDHQDKFKIYEITPKGKKLIDKSLVEFLSEHIGQPAKLIRCGGDNPIAAGREQWNDGTNVLTIRPGVVIAYERNYVTIEQLKQLGVTVITIPSSELSRGRGGPRCMSMPLNREDL